MGPSLQRVLTLRLGRSKDDTLELGQTKGGAPRFISPIPYGSLKSSTSGASNESTVDAEIIQGGSDWLNVDPSTHTAHLDVRCHFKDASTGGVYYMRMTGLIVLDEKVQPVLQWRPEAKTTESRDHYGFSSPVFEVSLEKDKWMERTAFVAHQHFVMSEDGGSSVEYEVYKLVTG